MFRFMSPMNETEMGFRLFSEQGAHPTRNLAKNAKLDVIKSDLRNLTWEVFDVVNMQRNYVPASVPYAFGAIT
jgi:hypothetical protein